MGYAATATVTETYTTADIENVVRRVTADLVMIATSSAAITEERARDYAHDIEVLATAGYLKAVDVTLLSAGTEVQAVRFDVNAETGELTTSRPGGVRWPRVLDPFLRLVIYHTDSYTQDAESKTSGKLRISWSPTNADTTHSSLKSSGGRDYVSNGYGMQRKDWTS